MAVEEAWQLVVVVAAFVAIAELEALVVIAEESDTFVATVRVVAVEEGAGVELAVPKTRARVLQNFQPKEKMVEELEMHPQVPETRVDC